MNGVTDVYSVDDRDTLLSVSRGGVAIRSFAYDAQGRTTSVTSSSGMTSYSYDYEDRVTGIGYPSTATNSFAYNAFDTRVSKSDSAGTASFMRDGVGVTAPVLSDGSSSFTPGVSQRSGSASTFQGMDRLGTFKVETDASQSVTGTRQYDAFGNPTGTTGTPTTPFAFAGAWGYQQDPDSGLMLLGHRYYDASTGRFLTRDPACDGRNWYGYCANHPLHFVDPGGLNLNETLLAVGTWIDDNLMGGAVSNAGATAGKYEMGQASGWEVAGASVIAAGAIIMTAVDLVDGVGEIQIGAAGVRQGIKHVVEEGVAHELGGDVAAKGGVYVLKDPEDLVKYVGSTNDFLRRRLEHQADPTKSGLYFDRAFGTTDRLESLLREQHLIDEFGGPGGGQLLNKINAIASKSLSTLH